MDEKRQTRRTLARMLTALKKKSIPGEKQNRRAEGRILTRF